MSLKKFEERRREALKEHEERLAKIAAEEAQEREKRIKPLSERFVTLFQEAIVRALNERVDELDKPRFRRAMVRARLEAFVKAEIDALVAAEAGDLSEDGEDGLEAKVPESMPEKPEPARKARGQNNGEAAVAPTEPPASAQ